MDKPILVFYLGFGEPEDREESWKTYYEIKEYLSSDQYDCFFVPVAGEVNSRVECINPKLLTQEDFAQAKETIVRAREALEKFLEDHKRIGNKN